MVLRLERRFFKETYTIGRLFIDGEYFSDTLEDKVREGEKVYGKTAIPYGVYKVVVSHSPKFGKQLPLICDVPNFTGIRIHGGVDDEDTLGCPLVGYNKRKGQLVGGLERSRELTRRLLEVQERGETILIEVCRAE